MIGRSRTTEITELLKRQENLQDQLVAWKQISFHWKEAVPFAAVIIVSALLGIG